MNILAVSIDQHDDYKRTESHATATAGQHTRDIASFGERAEPIHM